VAKLAEEEIKSNKQKKEELPPIIEWIKKIKFETTKDIKVPKSLLNQVIGQDKTVAIVRKAAEQKRHIMLIGDPGTGKSMVARAMTEFLPKGQLEDIIAYPNNEDTNTPHIRVVPGGNPNEIARYRFCFNHCTKTTFGLSSNLKLFLLNCR